VTLILGLGVLAVIWCLLIVWVARIAQGRGRNPVGWSLGAAIAGVLGMWAGLLIADRLIDSADISESVLIVAAAIIVPPIAMVTPMIVIGMVVQREPILISTQGVWPVTFMGKGEGTIAIEAGTVRLTWKDTSRDLAAGQLVRAEADGECVRLTLADDELVALPMGKPATPAGRRLQSLVLAKRLRSSPE